MVNVLLEKTQRNRRGKRRVEEAATVDFELTEEQRMICVVYLGQSPGDLSSLENPQVVEEIKRAA